MSLKNGIKETNTLARMQLLHEGGHLSRELYTEMRDAYEFLMQLRLVHQLQLLEQGRTPDNYIDPASLSELEKQTLKEAFGVIGRMHGVLKNLFRVG
jgi:CBS domain-containing protein